MTNRMKKHVIGVRLLLIAVMATMLVGCGSKAGQKTVSIVNVSYDPTREFYEEYNKLFADYWKKQTGQNVEVIQSHGGSGTGIRGVKWTGSGCSDFGIRV